MNELFEKALERMQEPVFNLIEVENEGAPFEIYVRSFTSWKESKGSSLQLVIAARAIDSPIALRTSAANRLVEARFVYTLNDVRPIEEQLAEVRSFVERQILAEVKWSPPDSEGGEEVLQPPKRDLGKNFVAYMQRLAQTVAPFKATGPKRWSLIVLKWLLRQVRLPEPAILMRDLPDLESPAGIHFFSQSLVYFCERLQFNLERRRIVSTELRRLLGSSPLLERIGSSLVLNLHYSGAPAWAVECLPRLFIRTGHCADRELYLVWLPLRDFLETRIGIDDDWDEGRLFCGGKVIEVILGPDALEELESGVTDAFEEARLSVSFGSEESVFGVVAEVFQDLEQQDRRRGSHTEAERLLNKRKTYLARGRVGFSVG